MRTWMTRDFFPFFRTVTTSKLKAIVQFTTGTIGSPYARTDVH